VPATQVLLPEPLPPPLPPLLLGGIRAWPVMTPPAVGSADVRKADADDAADIRVNPATSGNGNRRRAAIRGTPTVKGAPGVKP